MNTVLQKLAVLAVTLLTYLCASAYDFDTGGICYNITNATAKEVEVTKGDNRYSGSVVVPSSVTYNNKTYTVTAIGYSAFEYCYGLTSITLPSSVTAIGNRAFAGCSYLTSITTLSSSVTTIGFYAFRGCDSLTSIDVDSDNQKYSSVDGILYDKAQTRLIQCPGGKTGDVIIPNTVTAIGNYAFAGCSGLTSITLPNSLTTIWDDVFNGCHSLTSITLPNSITTIGNSAFAYSGLTSITLPSSVTNIGFSAFCGCDSLTSIGVDSDNQKYSSVDGILYDKAHTSLIQCPGGKTGDVIVPNTVTAIGDNAFWWCQNLTSITLPSSVTSIGRGAFSGCGSLTSIDVDSDNQKYSSAEGILYDKAQTILIQCPGGKTGDVIVPNSVTAIGDCAFYMCSGLTSITLPNSVAAIRYMAFYDCNGLTSITSYAVTPPGCGDKAFDGVDKRKCFLYVPAESIDAYMQADGWKDFFFIEEIETLRSFEVDGIYYNVTDPIAKEVEVTSGENKYSGNITVPSTVTYNDTQYTVTSIGEWAFSGCHSLTSITLPSSVTAIGEGAFTYCRGLTSIDVDSDNQKYSSVDGILYDKAQTSLICCPGGKSGDLIVPNTVTTIGEWAFEDCDGLTSITLPSSVTTIGDRAFEGCGRLTSITSYAVTPPGCGDAFSGVDKQKCFLYVPAESIDAYKQAEGWKDFAFIEEIGAVRIFEVDGIYYNVTDPIAKEVEVTSRENKYSGNITVPSTVTYNDTQYTVTAIGNYAFYQCNGLTSITLPSSVTTIGERAFLYCSGLTSIDVDSDNQKYSSAEGILYDKAQTSLIQCPGGKTGDVIVPNTVTTIGERAFNDCDGLNSITLPNSVTAIGTFAFLYCDGLTSITSHAVTPPRCGFYAFEGVDKQKCFLFVPAESIDAYKQAEGWKDFALIYEIGTGRSFEVDGIYYNVTDKTAKKVEVTKGENEYSGEITVPSTVTYDNTQYTVTAIGNEAFVHCNGLTSVVIGTSVTEIGKDAFYGCNGLVKSAYPNTISNPFSNGMAIAYPADDATIENGCVFNADKTAIYFVSITLEGEYTIPSDVVMIGENAFTACSGLTRLIASSADAPEINENSFEGLYDTLPLEVPKGSAKDYLLTSHWHLFKNLSAGDVEMKYFNDDVFTYHIDPVAKEAILTGVVDRSMTSASIPNRVAYEDGNDSFFCNITVIGSNAFAGMTSINVLKLSERLTHIGDNSFRGCTGLTSIVLPDALAGIGTSAFEGCSGLTSVTIPGSVEDFGDRAFYSCDKLGDMTFGFSASPIAIGNNAIPSALNTLTMGRDWVFDNPDEMFPRTLTSVNLDNGVTVIPESSFCNSNVSEVNISNTVQTIEDNAFNGCSGLSHLTLGSSVENIGNYAFNGCSLTDLVLSPAATTVGNNAFAGNDIKKLVMGANVTNVGEKAFDGNNAIGSVSITAINPPAASNNTFSYYDCPLYVPEDAMDNYYNSTRCWYRFSRHALIEAESVEISGETHYYGVKPGDTFKLTATISPADVSLPNIFWRSTNPAFATVDNDGNVTIQDPEAVTYSGIECEIIAETLYADSPVARVVLSQEELGVDNIMEDGDATGISRPNDIYNMQGVCLKRNASQDDINALAPGLYIVGGKKVVVK